MGIGDEHRVSSAGWAGQQAPAFRCPDSRPRGWLPVLTSSTASWSAAKLRCPTRGARIVYSGFTSQTVNGGSTWTSANHVGRFLNRFRFVRGPELVGYACGDTSISIQRHPPPT
jgi:hypothetical protein